MEAGGSKSSVVCHSAKGSLVSRCVFFGSFAWVIQDFQLDVNETADDYRNSGHAIWRNHWRYGKFSTERSFENKYKNGEGVCQIGWVLLALL
jgi:hypothetical protein